MKNAGFSLHLVFLAIVLGCSRADQRAADDSAGDTPKTGDASKSGQRTGAWTYQSTDYDFSLDLPSAGWKQMTKKRFLADFWCPTGTGSPMLAGVTSVKKQSREQFQTSIAQFKADVEKGGEYLLKPTFQEGQTESGNPYVYAALCEKGTLGSQFIYVTTAAVWLADKGITVTTIFEGQGQMRSKVFKSIEYAEFESAAKSICLSPR
jgi:hypothetical protein